MTIRQALSCSLLASVLALVGCLADSDPETATQAEEIKGPLRPVPPANGGPYNTCDTSCVADYVDTALLPDETCALGWRVYCVPCSNDLPPAPGPYCR
jgi:hypothetical protein